MKKAHKQEVDFLSITPNNKYLISSRNHEIRIWDIAKNKLVQTIKGDYNKRSSKIDANETELVIGIGGNQVHIYTYSGNESNPFVHTHSLLLDKDYELKQVKWDPTGEYIITNNWPEYKEEDNLCIWNVETNDLVNSNFHKVQCVYINTFTFSNNGDYLVVSEPNGTIYIYSSDVLQLLVTCDVSTVFSNVSNEEDYNYDGALILSFTPDDKYLVLEGPFHELLMLEFQALLSGSIKERFLCKYEGGITGIIIKSTEYSYLVYSCSWDGSICIHNVPFNQEEPIELINKFINISPVHSLAVDNLGKYLYSGDNEGYIQQWDISTGKKVTTIPSIYSY